MEFKFFRKPALLILGCLLTLSFSSCGGGDNGGGSVSGGGNPASPPQSILSGTVQAPPAAQIAFLPQRSLFEQFANVVLPSANALISGLSMVPDGTTVELDRINDSGTIVATISTTTTSGGNYSFDLTKLGVLFSSDLIVRVSNSTNTVQMRAFAGIGLTNINPVTETAVRMVLGVISTNTGMTLTNFTPQEQNDIMASIDLLITVNPLSAGLDMETSIAAIKNAVNVDPQVMGFITSASLKGQTDLGPGDIGNYLPNSTGNSWVYQGTTSTSPGSSTSFTKTDSFSGTRLFNGLVTSVLSEQSNLSGKILEDYTIKNNKGFFEYGDNDPSNFFVSQVAPVQQLIFPLQPRRTFGQFSKTGLNYGQDIDGDGIPETFDLTYQAKIVDFETVTVPVGTFSNVVKVEANLNLTVILSLSKSQIPVTVTEDMWLAPGIGPVKYFRSTETLSGAIQTSNESDTEELKGFLVGGKGQGIRIQIGPSSSTIQANTTQQFSATAYDQSNNPVYGMTFVWNSSNSGVATIDSNGLATGKGAGITTVTASVAGVVSNPATLTVLDVRSINLTTNDIIYDPMRQMIYASIPGNVAGGNTITTIDPVSGTIGVSFHVGVEPGKLAISDDSQYLYYVFNGGSSIGRLNLTNQTTDPPIVLTQSLNLGSPLAKDIKVLPGSPHSIAVSIEYSNIELAIFDDGVMRTNYIPRPSPFACYCFNSIDFSSSSSVLYASNGGGTLYRLVVNSSGISLFDNINFNLLFNSILKFDGGKIYFPLGNQIYPGTIYPMADVVNPGTISPNVAPSLIGSFIGLSSGITVLWPDSNDGRGYVLSGTYSLAPSSWTLFAFDLQTFGQINSMQVPGISGAPTNLFRWGTKGLAFRTDLNQVFLIRTWLIP